MKRIGFLSFGHWTPVHHAEVRTAADALLQSIELAVAAEELGLDGTGHRCVVAHRVLNDVHNGRRGRPRMHAGALKPCAARVSCGSAGDGPAAHEADSRHRVFWSAPACAKLENRGYR